MIKKDDSISQLGSDGNTSNSTAKAGAPLPCFAAMWRGYPEGHPSQARWQHDIVEQGVVLAHEGELKYPDQCVIKLSVALHAGGVDRQAYPGATTIIDGKRAGLGAAELAAWLERQAFCGLPLSLRVTGADWKERIAGKTGISYFANYWRRGGEAGASGDHIDLWNKTTLSPSIESFFSFRLGIERIRNPFDLLRGQAGKRATVTRTSTRPPRSACGKRPEPLIPAVCAAPRATLTR